MKNPPICECGEEMKEKGGIWDFQFEIRKLNRIYQCPKCKEIKIV
jgi:hypothetical protein